MTIRKQLFISFVTSIAITTLFLFILYKMMWFDGQQTLTLTLFSLISSMMTMMIAMTFSVPTIHKIERLNRETQKVSEGDFNIEHLDITSPLEVKELNESFKIMVSRVEQQMAQIKNEEAEKMYMVQNLAHDLKTPLASIKSYSEALRDGIIDTDEAHQHAYKVLINQADRLSHMFDDLTSMVSVTTHAQDKVALQVDQLLITILDPYQQQLEHEQRRLEVDVDESIPRFVQDKVAIERIISNFLDNALKFSETGTPITVRIKQETAQQLAISVSDEGPGIESKYLNRVFERTFRVDSSRNLERGGSGLGLYIAQTLAHQIGGHITIDSEYGKGTTITLHFPI
ncbi:sensor histidine kinase [Staphylococcus rostri]|uniref:histidine kinase n=1 Tax=Staphylococcus rostri TaxID=522262 RepID=A0A2K3YVX6_9STAP|nr:HAMP domain-containing sensor histidine kinase [Staphylococcus rostri]MDO5375295.1 HAMP domain-containing sensor histidine kinase [Staphylococcus rostri]PNZ29368.1 two-component sensor histidine kinase [Staphylococcus rostri]